jgi:HEPN domain-containing protein
MYAVLNSADWFALGCWNYLEERKNLLHHIGIKKVPTPEEYTQPIEELEKREIAVRLLKEVIELLDKE